MGYIGIEGIIGSGKSTLAQAMSETLGWRWLPEPVDENICLKDFYEDPKRWAFQTQMYFMYQRTKMHMHATYSDVPVILDRTLPGDRCFAKLHTRYGNMHELEWKIYEASFDVANAVRAPSLVIFLEVDPSVAMARIQRRARDVENGIQIKYLEDLDYEYESLIHEIESGNHQWSRGIKVLRVPWNEELSDPRSSMSYEHIISEARRYLERR